MNVGVTRRVLTILAIIAIASGCTGDSASKHSQKVKTAEPKTVVHDFGRVVLPAGASAGLPLLHTFLIPNESASESMRLRLIGSSCSCTVAEISDETIAPGQSGKVTVTVNSGTTARAVNESAMIEAGSSPLKLTIAAEIVPRMEIKLVPSTNLHTAPGVNGRLLLSAKTNQPLSEAEDSIKISSQSELINIVSQAATKQQTEGDVRASSQEAVIEFRCPPADDGLSSEHVFSGNLVVEHGGNRVVKSIEWYRRNPIHQLPTQVFVQFGRDDTIEKSISLSASQAFKILRIADSPKGVELKFDSASKQTSHHLTLLVTPKAFEGSFGKFSVYLETDHPNQPKFALIIFCLRT